MRKIFMIFTILLMVLVLAGEASACDPAAPQPTAGTPARGAVNVPVDTQITTTFNEEIMEGTMDIQLVKSGTPVAITSSISGNVLTVTPNSPLEKGSKYTLILQPGSVTDVDGNLSEYYSRSFCTDGTAPKPKAGSPARNAMNVPLDTVITTTFNEPIKAGTMDILLKYGSTPVSYTSSINDKVLTITPDSPLLKGTMYTLILKTGSLTDLTGNSIAYYSRPFTTDGTGPKAIAGSPARNGVNVPVDTVITTTFNENIFAGSGNILLVKKGGGQVAITTSINGKVLTVTPDSLLDKASTYTLVLEAGSLKDIAGNSIAPYSRSFTTDSTAPKAIAGSPARDAMDVPVNTVITTTFNEPIKYGAGAIQLFQVIGDTINVIDITHSINGNVLTVTPTAPLSSFTAYVLLLYPDSITDLAGNGIDIYARGFITILTY